MNIMMRVKIKVYLFLLFLSDGTDNVLGSTMGGIWDQLGFLLNWDWDGIQLE